MVIVNKGAHDSLLGILVQINERAAKAEQLILMLPKNRHDPCTAPSFSKASRYLS